MKKDKQIQILSLFKSKLYRCENDKVYKRRSGLWKEVKGNPLTQGYEQITFYDGIIRTICFRHIAVYLYYFGEYDEWLEIDHLDRNNKNNLPANLQAKTTSQNRLNTIRPPKYNKFKTIRRDQIKLIRKYLAEGANQSQIAKKMELNRLAVRYVIKKIEAKQPLKYE